MFAKGLPLDYNNHNYMYNMVRTKKKIVISDGWNNPALPHPGSSPLPYPEYCLQHPEVCTDGKEDDDKENTQLLIHMGYILLFCALVLLVWYITKELVNIVKGWCSDLDSEKTPLLKK